MKRQLATLVVALTFSATAAAHRCMVDGRPVFQDRPCPEAGETVAEGLEQQQRIENWHRKLDQMQARGVGLVQRAAPPPRPPPPADEVPPYIGPRRSGVQRLAHEDAIDARLAEKSRAQNVASAARLTEILDKASEACGGSLPPLPKIGMSDETFRMCTLHARFGGATQVVALEVDNVPLRLYIFPTTKAQRVYSVGGVITAIKP